MTTSPITTAYLDLSPDIRARAEEIAGSNRPVTWPEVLLLVGTAIAGERERGAGIADTLGVYPELNVFGGGPEWYRHGKDIAAAIRRPAAPEIKERIE